MKADWKEKRERVSDAGKAGKCSRWMGYRQRKSGDQGWRVLSEGCADREGQRRSEENGMEYRG